MLVPALGEPKVRLADLSSVLHISSTAYVLNLMLMADLC